MTVKDVFDLRREGKIEEAYEAIRPMYASHKGRYTTLCMFWTASDVFKLRMDEGRTDEAEKICRALQRMLPRVQEIEQLLQEERGFTGEHTSSGSAQFFVDYAQKRLEELPSEPEEQKEQETADEGESPQQIVDVRNIKGLTPIQRIVLGFIAANPGNEIPSISYGLGIPAKIVENHISALLDRGLIEHRDTKKDGGYHVKR